MIENPQIVLIDYGIGNLYSISRAFANFDIDVIITRDPKIILDADGIILPGVGAFATAMKGLEEHNLFGILKQVARANKPMLGICVGAQVLMTEGYEFGVYKGLDIISGKVIKFPQLDNNEKIPQIGWNTMYPKFEKYWGNTIFETINANDQVYFVHSYFLQPQNQENILALTTYGGFKFCSAIKKDKIGRAHV